LTISSRAPCGGGNERRLPIIRQARAQENAWVKF